MNHISSACVCTVLSLFLGAPASHAGFKTSPEKVKSANEVWGIGITRGVRVSSEKADTLMTIDTREDHLNKTVAPRVPSIQSNRELLRTMPTCFDPDDPARIPWYGNVKDNIASGGGGGGGGGSIVNKTASWTFEVKLWDGSNSGAIVPDYSASADFPAETAGYAVSTSDPVYIEGDPSIPTGCSIISPCSTYYVISVNFSSTDPSLTPLDACSKSGVTFTYDSSESTSLVLPNTTITQHPTCANGMTLGLKIAQPFLCGMTGDDLYCAYVLSAYYRINATWNETSSAPPPEAGTTLHEPVIYSYDPKECNMP